MSALRIAGVLSVAMLLAACGDEAPTTVVSSSAQAAKVASAKPSAVAATAAAPTATGDAMADALGDDVPTPADFEEEAASDIHPDNAEAELAGIEKELAQDQ